MPFIVEDGSGVADANAYVSTDYVEEYAEEHGLKWNAVNDENYESAIRRATTYIDGYYREKFPGTPKLGREQGLEWPRIDAYDIWGYLIDPDTVPREIEMATAEAAVNELATPGYYSPNVTTSRVIQSATVDVISVTYADDTTVAGQRPVDTTIDDILSRLFRTTSGGNTGFVYLKRA